MAVRRPAAMVSRHELRHDIRPTLHRDVPTGDVLLSPADLSEAMHELDSLRSAHRLELAARLREARAYGTAIDDDDHLAVLEDVAVERIKIAQLERLIASATVVDVDAADDDVAGLGWSCASGSPGPRNRIRVGRAPGHDGSRAQVTPASPVGEALMGARSGDVVESRSRTRAHLSRSTAAAPRRTVGAAGMACRPARDAVATPSSELPGSTRLDA